MPSYSLDLDLGCDCVILWPDDDRVTDNQKWVLHSNGTITSEYNSCKLLPYFDNSKNKTVVKCLEKPVNYDQKWIWKAITGIDVRSSKFSFVNLSLLNHIGSL